MEASPNWIRSDKLIIYSDLEGENRNELQARQCELPGRILKAPVPSLSHSHSFSLFNKQQ